MKKLITNIFLALIILLIISGLFALYSSPLQEVKEVSFDTVVKQINEGLVSKITVKENNLEIELKDGIKEKSKKEKEAGLTQSLLNYGVKQEKLKEVTLEIKEESSLWVWLLTIIPFVLPLIILGVIIWFMFRQAQKGQTQVFSFGKSNARLTNALDKKNRVTFKDVAGVEEAKEELKEIVDFLKHPKKFLDIGARIPRGVLLMGPPGTGKCITGESFVTTSKGLIKIKDIPKYFRVDKTGKIYGGEVFTIDLKNLKAKKETPSHWFDLGEQKTIKIISQLGVEIEGTPEHPIVILEKETGNFKFKRLDQIKKGDVLIVNYNHQVFNNWSLLPNKKTAYLLGLLTGDGGLSIRDKIYFSTSNKELLNFVKNYFKTHFKTELKKVTSKKYDWYISSRKVKEKLKEYGLTETYAQGKTIPESIILGPKEHQVAFLQGLFDTDGGCNIKNGTIQLSSASENLIRQVNILLLNLGIINRVHSRKKIYNKQLQYYIEISGDFIKNFAKEIGFGIKEKQKKLEKILIKKGNTNINLVPYQNKRLEVLWDYFKSKTGKLNRAFYRSLVFKNLWRYIKGKRNPSKEGLDRILEFFSLKIPSIKNLSEYKYLQELGDNRFFFTPVTKIIKNRKARVYDFTVPRSHSFVANGLINHNTLLARAVAGEAKVPFFHMSGSEFVEMFVGVGASRVRDLFRMAKKAAPAIVFIDEIDAVGRHRGAGLGGGHDEREQTLNQILVEMDGFERDTNIIVIAATNRPDILDPALLRPGRFDRRVVLGLPDIKEREEIHKIHAKNKRLASDVDFRRIAERTPGFSGADLANLINEAAILAARHNKKTINQQDLLDSIEKVLLGPERKSHILSKKEKEIAAYHEAGHALVAANLKHTDPIHKVSIVSRGKAAGYTLKLPSEDKYFKTRSEFLDELAVFLGGYCAEKLIFNEITTGATSDLQQASELARAIVTRYGMSEKLGPVTFGKPEELVFLGKEIVETRNYSEEMAAEIDKEIEKLIRRAQKTAENIIRKKIKTLKKIAKTLIKKEVLEKEDFEKLIKEPKTKNARNK